jgi:D-cysteine desulfhydrase
VGVRGFVDAGLELAMQVERKEMPPPKVIYLPVGSCGTLAGLVLGLRLAGMRSRVVGVQVAPRLLANPRAASRLARKALSSMRRHDRSIPEIELGPEDFPMDRDHYGSGYGQPTDGARRALALMAKSDGIELDLTYTAKTLSALLYRVRSERERGPVLFWNTFNGVDLSSMADRVEFSHLPGEFHRFFEGKLVE